MRRPPFGKKAPGFAAAFCAAAAIAAGAASKLPAQEAAAAPLSAEQEEFFEKEIRPLLADRCFECHSGAAEEPEGGLRLDSRQGWLRGGDSGPTIAPGSPDTSLLIRAVRRTDPLIQMPPDGKLADREIEALERWVRMCAPDPRVEVKPPAAAEANLAPDAVNWWALQPLSDPEVPAVEAAWPDSPIDRFVLARQEAVGLSPAPQAAPRVLLRRMTFDLTGLPPTPEEIGAFEQAMADRPATAMSEAVDRLLASKHYGERWGRHWLDVVRYADTSGCNGDFPMPQAYRYRNYVVDSFNRDKPYDEFLREQLAGDLLPAESDEERFEQTIATGYLAISRRFSSVAEEFHLTLDDTVDNLGKAILGLTVSCARCHDHKFDPIPQRDYYALYGIFQSTTYAFPGTEIYRHAQHLTPLVPSSQMESELRPHYDNMAQLDAKMFEIYSQMEKLDTGQFKEEQRAKFEALLVERDELLKKLPEHPQAYAAAEAAPTSAQIHIKGDPKNLGPAVARGFLQVLGGQTLSDDESGSGRLSLANWIADAANPLTARVMVNRVWLHHFGRGLVRTPDDFGVRGAPPTHPELLDWLTRRFIESGSSLKSLHRTIMLSRTYQMACVENADFLIRDPANSLLWTFNRRRLEAEEVRDAMLLVSGALDRSTGGPHPFPPEWEWRYTQHNPFLDDYPTHRRSIYLMQQRIRPQPLLAVFDGADTNTATGLRQSSATVQQALFLLNNPFVHEQSAHFADRLAHEASGAEERIARAYALALGRPAREDEISAGLDFLERLESPLAEAGVPDDDRSRSAWAAYLRALLASNDFVFID